MYFDPRFWAAMDKEKNFDWWVSDFKVFRSKQILGSVVLITTLYVNFGQQKPRSQMHYYPSNVDTWFRIPCRHWLPWKYSGDELVLIVWHSIAQKPFPGFHPWVPRIEWAPGQDPWPRIAIGGILLVEIQSGTTRLTHNSHLQWVVEKWGGHREPPKGRCGWEAGQIEIITFYTKVELTNWKAPSFYRYTGISKRGKNGELYLPRVMSNDVFS